MKFFALKFVVLTIFFSLGTDAFSLKSDDINIDFREVTENNLATFEVILPPGWKMAKAPGIKPLSNDKKFIYQENFEKITDSRYKVRCYLDPNKKNCFKFEFFVCNDVCAIVSKDFQLPPLKSESKHLLMMIIFGFIGGLLLNVMPCVLPIVLLKLKHITSRKSVLFSIFGNYLSFFLLASILFLLKLSGESVGWGFYFQNIYFLKFSVALFFVMTLISFDKLHLYVSFNHKGFENQEKWKDIFSSMITTLIAIPCTAPLLGTAAAFAIQESFLNLFLIFGAIATGFSVPYFLASLMKSSSQNWLKKPILNKLVNYGVLVTFIWLFWILTNRISILESTIFVVAFSTSFVLLTKKFNKLALIMLVIPILISIPTKSERKNTSLLKVFELVDKNRIVILNITADWCLSCKYNKLKFQSHQVTKQMRENAVEFVEIDITEQNKSVMEFIKSHSRIGIPFTIVYGPHKKQGLLLSEMPTVSEITKAIELVK